MRLGSAWGELFIGGPAIFAHQMQGSFQDFNVDWGHILLEPDKLDEETSRLYRQSRAEQPRLPVAPAAPAAPPPARGGGRRRGRGRGVAVGKRKRTKVFGLSVPSGDAVWLGGLDQIEEEDDDDGEEEDDGVHARAGGSDDDSDSDDPAPAPAPADSAAPPEPPPRLLGPFPPAMTFTVGEDYRRFYVIPGNHRSRNGIMGHYIKPFMVDVFYECIPFPVPAAYGNPDYMKHPDACLFAGIPGLPWPDESVCKAVLAKADDVAIIPTADMFKGTQFNWEHRQSFIDEFIYVANNVGNIYAENAFNLPRYDFHASDSIFRHPGPHNDKDPSNIPDFMLMEINRDYVAAPPPWESPHYYEIGAETLKKCVERGELLDLAFARRIMGLLGVSQDAVWACLDPDFNPADRQEILARFDFLIFFVCLLDLLMRVWTQVHQQLHAGLLQECQLGRRAGRAGRGDPGDPAAQGGVSGAF